MHISPSHEVAKQIVSPTQTMVPKDFDDKKIANNEKVSFRKRRIEQNEKESLDLFNKIEAEKNQRLNIDEENILENDPNGHNEEQASTNYDKQTTEPKEDFTDDSHNRSSISAASHKVLPRAYPDANFEILKTSTSFEKHDQDPIDFISDSTPNRDLTPTHNHHSGDTGNGPTSTPHTGGGAFKFSQSDQTQIDQNEEFKKAEKEIILKPRGFTQNGKALKIDLIFQNPYREITFEYNLQTDTPEGVCNEMKQADFGISDAEAHKIKKDISIIVHQAIDKIKKSSSVNVNQDSFCLLTPKTMSETSSSTVEPKTPSKVVEQQVDPKVSERTKSLEIAQYAIHHFIKSVDQEIQTVVRHQNDIEQLNSSLDSETFSISMQFIKEVVDSYRNFQTKLHKTRQGSKSKSQANQPPSPNSLKQAKSFKNTGGQNLTTGRLEKQGSGILPHAEIYSKGAPF